MIAARDHHGIRPLAIGRKGDAWFVASETVGFDIIDAEYVRDVQPGEIVVFDKSTRRRAHHVDADRRPAGHSRTIAFSNTSIFRGRTARSSDTAWTRCGGSWERISRIRKPVTPNDPDDKVVVINVPDSSNTATMGFVQQTNKNGGKAKLEIGLIRSHYIGRTFIQPGQDVRENKVKTKFNTVKGVLKDKVVVIVDDSIVRGTTSKQLVQLVRQAEPKEVHFRVTAPPIMYPCHYGMDFPTPKELIANQCGGDVSEDRQGARRGQPGISEHRRHAGFRSPGEQGKLLHRMLQRQLPDSGGLPSDQGRE